MNSSLLQIFTDSPSTPATKVIRRLGLGLGLTLGLSASLLGCNGNENAEVEANDPTGATWQAIPDQFPYENFGGPLSESVREAQIASIRSEIRSLNAGDFDYAEDLTDAVEAKLKNLPTVAFLNRSADRITLTVQLRDGTPWFFSSGRSFGPDHLTRVSPRVVSQIRETPAKTSPFFARARLKASALLSTLSSPMSSIQSSSIGPNDDASNKGGESYLPRGRTIDLQNCLNLGSGVEFSMESMFSQKGYSARKGTCQLTQLRSLVNMDLLWISSHGIPYTIKLSPTGVPIKGYVLVTGDHKKPCADLPQAECTANRADIAAMRIVSGDLDPQGDEVWGVTANFVREYWSFRSTRSLVWVDACEMFGRSSLSNTPFGDEFRLALKDKGAGVILGWKDQVYQSGGDRIVKKFFDYSFGMNQETQLTPKFRPWPAGDVYALMDSRGEVMDSAPNGFARFMYEPGRLQRSGLLLAPTISFLVVDSAANELRIQGDFGDETGEVTISGIPVSVRDWKASQIKVPLSQTGPTSFGEVRVSVRGSTSNTVPITQWSGTLEVKTKWKRDYGAPGPELKINCDLSYREDFHLYRPSISESPRWVSDSTTLATVERSGRCNWIWDGEGVDSDGNTTRVSAIGPSSAVPVLVNPDGFTVSLTLWPRSRSFSFAGLGLYPEGRAITKNPNQRIISQDDRTFYLDWQQFLPLRFSFAPETGVIEFNESKTIGDSGDPGTQKLLLQPTSLPTDQTES